MTEEGSARKENPKEKAASVLLLRQPLLYSMQAPDRPANGHFANGQLPVEHPPPDSEPLDDDLLPQ
jgi:hypothetical protein